MFFPHQANASFHCQKCRKSFANWSSNITQIAAKTVQDQKCRKSFAKWLSNITQIAAKIVQAQENKRINHICFWKNNEIEINSHITKNLLQQAPPIMKAF